MDVLSLWYDISLILKPFGSLYTRFETCFLWFLGVFSFPSVVLIEFWGEALKEEKIWQIIVEIILCEGLVDFITLGFHSYSVELVNSTLFISFIQFNLDALYQKFYHNDFSVLSLFLWIHDMLNSLCGKDDETLDF